MIRNLLAAQTENSLNRDGSVVAHKIKSSTVQRVFRLARPYAAILTLFLFIVVIDAAAGVANPLIYRKLINEGIVAGNARVVVNLALLAAGVALLNGTLTFAQRFIAARVGLNMVFDVRTKIFARIQRMPLAFFSRARTGALVSRINNDVSGVRDAFTEILSTAVGNLVTVTLMLTAMFALSWKLTLSVLVLLLIFLIPARYVGRRLRVLTRETYTRAAEINSVMIERFNVAGAMVAKIYGRPEGEDQIFARHAARLRDIAIVSATYMRSLFISISLVISLATAAVYGWGGILAVQHALDIGTLVALAYYLTRLHGPLTALPNLQVDVMTALVSFERVFEVLDLEPTVAEKPGAKPIPPGPARIVFDCVGFRYPSAAEVSLASLESVAVSREQPENQVLHDVSFVAEPGQLIALVGPSGAGKTTLVQLAARLYDVRTGSVQINGVDVREATLESIQRTVGMVMQEAHLFHDTIRANLLYAKPSANETELIAVLRDAQVLSVVEALPLGLDTVVGDRGHRLSGGEKQRIAIARLLLKAPPVVILDEATAHLDSESERAIQRAFQSVLAGRTSLVIAHRLSTVQHADQILVIERGRVVEQGRHESLLAAGKLYAQLYRTQFSGVEQLAS